RRERLGLIPEGLRPPVAVSLAARGAPFHVAAARPEEGDQRLESPALRTATLGGAPLGGRSRPLGERGARGQRLTSGPLLLDRETKPSPRRNPRRRHRRAPGAAKRQTMGIAEIWPRAIVVRSTFRIPSAVRS